MTKRSRRRPSRYERDQAGCIWSLISIFDFRHDRTTKRLLADRGRESKQAAEYSSNEAVILGLSENCESIEDADGSKRPVPMADVAKTSVKELMEEEMIKELGSENQANDSEMGLVKSNSDYINHLKKHEKKRNRGRSKSRDMDVSQLDLITENPNQVPNQRPSNNLDLEKILKELTEINERTTNSLKHDHHSDLDVPSDETMTSVEEKLVAAIKLFIDQRLSGSKRFGDEGNHRCSREFMDVLRTLSSNEGLYLKLLQDPDSKLVEHVQNLEGARLGRDQTPSSLSVSRLSEEKPVNSKVDEPNGRKPRNFFRRRSKSMESYPLGGEKDFESGNNIIILKPGPTGAQSPGSNRMVSSLQLHLRNGDNKLQNEKNMSQFSFTEIKRKLRHAMGKERQGVSLDTPTRECSPKQQNGNNVEKGSTGENFGWSSPNRNHKYMERFLISSPKKGEQVGKLKDNSSAVVNETCQNPRFGGSNIYIEARKHLSEMLMNGDGNPELVTGQLPKSLGRILSLPEYKGSPCCSPRKYGDDIFITAQTRLSPRSIVKSDLSGPLQEKDSNHPSPRRRNVESQPGISGNNSEDKVESLDMDYNILIRDDHECSLEVESFTNDATIPEVKSLPSIVAEIEEMTESRPHEEETSKASNNLNRGDFEEDTGDEDNTEIAPEFFKESSTCFESPSFGGDQVLSSSVVSPPRPVSSEVEDSDCSIEKMGRPSPVSVLEPLFTDDDISPASTTPQPVEKELQPRRIHFEEQSSACDQGICTRISFEDEESAFEYVEAVLLGSGLNWDEFLMRWLSTYEILDSSLFDEVELFSSRPHYDQKFLFDCANEALKEVCDIYFGCYSGTSCVELNIQPPPKGMDLIQKIWQRVEQLLQHPQPHSLDQLVKTDLARSTKWMNLRSDIELIVFEMGETIFIELVEEIVPSFEDDTFELSVHDAEPNASETANS